MKTVTEMQLEWENHIDSYGAEWWTKEVDTVDMEEWDPGNVVDVSSKGDATVEHHAPDP